MAHRRAGAVIAALGLVAGAIVAVQGFARPSASYDFGDAPDGANASYADKPDLVARFPSKAASGGPRHGAGPRLGATSTAEPASRQVDRDADDGAEVVARSCAVSTLTLAVDARRADPAAPIYVNAWFDWNQDGDWTDGGTGTCGPEWGLQNAQVDPASLEDGVGVVTLRFRAGKVPRQYWWRAQVHQGSAAPHRGGGGQAAPTPGETEDRLHGRVPKAAQSLVCAPEHAIMTHGGVHDIDFRLLGRTPDLGILRSRGGLRGETDGVRVRRPAIPDGWRVRIVSTARHDRKPIAQSFQLDFVVDARINGKPRLNAFRTACRVTIVHGAPIFPPFTPPRQLRPAVTVPTVRVVVNPDRPTPQQAKCGARVSDGLAYFRVETVCRGVDVKSLSIHYATEPAKRWSGGDQVAGGRWLDRCGPSPGLTGFRCWWTAGNARRVLEVRVVPPAGGQTRITLHVLAGGYNETGTAIVLRQVWYARGGGQFICIQTDPPAKTCAGVG